VVLFRHEKTFYNKPGVFVKVSDDLSEEEIKVQVSAAESFVVNYVGINLSLDGFAVECTSGEANNFSAAVSTVRSISKRPLILVSADPTVVEAGLRSLDGETPLIYGANASNWEAMAEIAKQKKAVLGLTAAALEEAAELTEKIKGKGLEDIVLGISSASISANLLQQIQIRRLALKKNFKPLGYPTITFPTNAAAAAQAITKYAGFVVLDKFSADFVYPLLVLRQNIYTDPQKPIQVQPGVYEINNPKAEDPVLVTTNFSITYFSVANEVEGSGLPAWLLVTDAEGMSVLTAWAAGKFDAERIAKAVKTFNVADKVSRKRIVIPGAVAVLSGELEAELPDWAVRVGPREAVDIPKFMKLVLQ